jgi:hypothetical protein
MGLIEVSGAEADVAERQPTFFEQIEESVPERCLGCPSAEELCRTLAKYPLKGAVSIGWISDHLRNDFDGRCPLGKGTSTVGWGNRESKCNRDATPIGVNIRRRVVT